MLLLFLFYFITFLTFQNCYCIFSFKSNKQCHLNENLVCHNNFESLFKHQNSFKAEENEGKELFYTYKSVCLINNQIELINDLKCENQIAAGRFRNAINITGWSFLEIETMPGFDHDLQAYSAGILEGALTQKVLDYTLQNTYYSYCEGYQNHCKKLNNYLTANLVFIKNMIENASKNDPFWQSIRRSLLQITGLWNGFKNTISFDKIEINYEIHSIMMINLNGEFYDLDTKFNKTKDPINSELGSKCSGLVKVTPNNADLLFSQVSKNGYQTLLRVLKLYKFGYGDIPGHTTTMSSYPGMIFSSDDYALISSGLAIMETTIAVWNETLFEKVKPENQVHAWLRAIAANQLAQTGQEWCEIFSRYNSGTYNNQWIILDYKQFKPFHPLPDKELLYVLEQMPGLIEFKDVTKILKNETYFATFNIPILPGIFKVSGYDKMEAEFDWFSRTNSPRAKIFKRDHSKVVDLESLQRLMRYNDFMKDPLSRCNCTPPYTAQAAISARGDLNDPNGTYPLWRMSYGNHGALDYKGNNYELFKRLEFRALSSPPYENVPPFQWSKFGLANSVKHVGHPDLWNFYCIETKWETPNIQVNL